MDPHNDNYDHVMFKLNQYKYVNIVNFMHNVNTRIKSGCDEHIDD